MELTAFQAHVGANLKKARETAGLSPKQLREKTGLGKGHISDCESGKKNLTLDTIRRYSEGCNVEPEMFFKR